MSTLTIAFPDVTRAADPTRRASVRRRELGGRTSGRGTAPRSRPARAVAPPSLGSAPRRPVAQACAVDALPSALRLTDRGIAVVLAAGLLIMLAALVVVGLTAARVTGLDYVPHGQAQIVRR